MEKVHSPSSRSLDRRTLVRAGTAAAAGVWVAPSVLTLDRAEAAVGSCGTKPRRVDFSRWSGSLLPTNFTSDDGSVSITFRQSDPSGVQDSYWSGRVSPNTVNGRDNPVVTGMSNATNGDWVRLRFDFSAPVALSFHLIDIDLDMNAWEDTVQVQGRPAGGGAWVSPSSMVTGGAQTQTGTDTVRGDYSTTGADGNVEIDFQVPIRRLVIDHRDDTSWTDFQWIGVHDFHWC